MADTRTYTWADYELAKRDWLRLHPEATQTEIEQACRAIAERMGL